MTTTSSQMERVAFDVDFIPYSAHLLYTSYLQGNPSHPDGGAFIQCAVNEVESYGSDFHLLNL